MMKTAAPGMEFRPEVERLPHLRLLHSSQDPLVRV